MTRYNNNSGFRIQNNILKGKEVAYTNNYGSLGEFVLDTLEKDSDFVGQKRFDVRTWEYNNKIVPSFGNFLNQIDAVTGEEYSYGKMRERSIRCALWMRFHGLLPRDVVTVCSDDHLDFAISCFATFYLGAILNTLDVTMDSDNLYHRMSITKPKMVFVSKGSATVVAKAAERTKLKLKIIVFGCVSGFLEFNSIIAEPDISAVNKFKCMAIESPGKIASILFSSGTTGLPKGVALSHQALIMLLNQSAAFGMAGNVCMTFTATHWITAISTMSMSLLLKIPRIILPSFEVDSSCALIARYKVSWVYVTPFIINKLVKSESVSKHDLSFLTKILCSGAPLHIASYKSLAKLLPNAQISSVYGLTESCVDISMQSTKSQPGSCGEIIENTQLKVVDPDTGRALGANEKGEILTKSEFMMSFYWDNAKTTSQAIDKQGWLHTGDFGYYNENGEIFVIDRLMDVMRRGHYVVSPSEIESVILSDPRVKEVAVVSQPRHLDEDIIIAFVARSEDSPETSEQVTDIELIDLIASELPDCRQLNVGVRFIDHIPRTSTDKVQRSALRNLARSFEIVKPSHAGGT